MWKDGKKLDKGTLYVEFLGPEDEHGRRSFFLYWWMENFHMGPQWRAQIFHAPPANHLKGKHVVLP